MSEQNSNPSPHRPQKNQRTIHSGLVERDQKINEINDRVIKQRLWIGGGVIIIIALVIAVIILSAIVLKMPKTETFQTIDNSVICKLNPNENPAFTDTSSAEFA